MPTRVAFQAELDRMLQSAQQQGFSHIDVTSGDLHRRVGGYPGRNHRMPICCSVMRGSMTSGDTVLQEPPKGKGATLIVRYKLPRRTSPTRGLRAQSEQLSTGVAEAFETSGLASVVRKEGAIGMWTELSTWRGRSKFKYSGSVSTGTVIRCGKEFRWEARMSEEQWERLLSHFRGRMVSIGTSRTDPPPDSVGEWLQEHVTKTAIASYVGPILIHEGYASRDQKRDRIRFHNGGVGPGEPDYLQRIQQRVAKLEKLDPTMREEMERGLREVEGAPHYAAVAMYNCLRAVVRSLEGPSSSSGKDLYGRIQDLEDVPGIVINHMHTVRTTRNTAVHAGETLRTEDVYPSIEAMACILEWWEATC